MPKTQHMHADDYERWPRINGKIIKLRGYAFFETREQCKAAAKTVRKRFNIPCRAVVVKGTFFGYDDRYNLMLPEFGRYASSEPWPEGIKDFIAEQPGFEV